jgi:hypothetical protein
VRSFKEHLPTQDADPFTGKNRTRLQLCAIINVLRTQASGNARYPTYVLQFAAQFYQQWKKKNHNVLISQAKQAIRYQLGHWRTVLKSDESDSPLTYGASFLKQVTGDESTALLLLACSLILENVDGKSDTPDNQTDDGNGTVLVMPYNIQIYLWLEAMLCGPMSALLVNSAFAQFKDLVAKASPYKPVLSKIAQLIENKDPAASCFSEKDFPELPQSDKLPAFVAAAYIVRKVMPEIKEASRRSYLATDKDTAMFGMCNGLRLPVFSDVHI